MEDQRFDELAKRFARPVSRRQMVKALLATAFGGMVVHSGTATVFAQGNSDAAHWCHAHFTGAAAGQCTSQAAQGQGPYYQCGPGAPPNNGLTVCGNNPATACVNTQSDVTNCGGCGQACAAGQGCCRSVCSDLTTNQNCGTCSNTCLAPNTCGGGGIPEVCGCTPNCAGKTCGDNNCGGSCGTCSAANCETCNGSGTCVSMCSGSTPHCCGGTCLQCCSASDCPSATCSTAACTNGTCTLTPIAGCCISDSQCDDGNPCTTDTCNTQTNTCSHTPVADGTPCAGGTCRGGTCVPCTVSGLQCTTNTECCSHLCCGGLCCSGQCCEGIRCQPTGTVCCNDGSGRACDLTAPICKNCGGAVGPICCPPDFCLC